MPTKTKTAKRKSTVRLQERTLAKPIRVDREAGVIRGVKIIGRYSQNGREYTPEALREAASLYEGAKVNIDHRKPGSGSRAFSDRFGVLRDVRYIDTRKGLVGDLHYIKAHTMAETIVEAAERFPESFGLSHDADGKTVRRNGKMIVESIERVNSVDVVADPATTAGLFEHTTIPGGANTDPKRPDTPEAKTVQKILEPIESMLFDRNRNAAELVAELRKHVRGTLAEYADDGVQESFVRRLQKTQTPEVVARHRTKVLSRNASGGTKRVLESRAPAAREYPDSMGDFVRAMKRTK